MGLRGGVLHAARNAVSGFVVFVGLRGVPLLTGVISLGFRVHAIAREGLTRTWHERDNMITCEQASAKKDYQTLRSTMLMVAVGPWRDC